MKIEFSGSCKVDRVAELKDLLCSALEQSGEVELDVSGVESCDATLIQLLCSAQKTAAQSGKTLTVLESPSEPFRSLLQESGLVHACQHCDVETCVKEEIFS
jgi:ABC-type transporter Mla MlaB component